MATTAPSPDEAGVAVVIGDGLDGSGARRPSGRVSQRESKRRHTVDFAGTAPQAADAVSSAPGPARASDDMGKKRQLSHKTSSIGGNSADALLSFETVDAHFDSFSPAHKDFWHMAESQTRGVHNKEGEMEGEQQGFSRFGMPQAYAHLLGRTVHVVSSADGSR